MQDDKALEEMKTYIETYISKDSVVTNIKMPSGRILACVGILVQPALRREGMENRKIQLEPRNFQIKGKVSEETNDSFIESIETGIDTNFPPREKSVAQLNKHIKRNL